MTEVIDLEAHRDKDAPHFSIIAFCLMCDRRWIGSVPARTSLFTLECPECGSTKSFASFLPDAYMENFQ